VGRKASKKTHAHDNERKSSLTHVTSGEGDNRQRGKLVSYPRRATEIDEINIGLHYSGSAKGKEEMGRQWEQHGYEKGVLRKRQVVRRLEEMDRIR